MPEDVQQPPQVTMSGKQLGLLGGGVLATITAFGTVHAQFVVPSIMAHARKYVDAEIESLRASCDAQRRESNENLNRRLDRIETKIDRLEAKVK